MKNFLIITLALFSLNAFSQTRENWEYWNTWVYKPKAGMIEQFEKAAGKKTEKFNSSKDNLIVTFKVVTGANSGQYVRMMPWQSLADYDRDRSEELKYWQENVAKYADAIGDYSYKLVYDKDIKDNFFSNIIKTQLDFRKKDLLN